MVFSTVPKRTKEESVPFIGTVNVSSNISNVFGYWNSFLFMHHSHPFHAVLHGLLHPQLLCVLFSVISVLQEPHNGLAGAK